MPHLRRAVSVAVLAGILLSSCSIVGGGAKKQTVLSAWFPKTIALFPASEVRVLGLPAGKVSKVQAMGDRVRIEMKIKESVPVPADVHATIVPLSLIGERYVQLFPVWTNGQPRARSSDVIPMERTEVPVEPDEALAALKKFLDSLDPSATGRLVQNAANDLKGNGQTFNDTVANLSTLVGTLADKDQQLGDIIDNFDKFTVVLRTREVELGHVMDSFANLTSLLAEERKAIESTVRNLGHVSTDAFDLLSVNRAGIDKDLAKKARDKKLAVASQTLARGRSMARGASNRTFGPFADRSRGTQLGSTGCEQGGARDGELASDSSVHRRRRGRRRRWLHVVHGPGAGASTPARAGTRRLRAGAQQLSRHADAGASGLLSRADSQRQDPPYQWRNGYRQDHAIADTGRLHS